jgi:RNA polymerase sigma factor (sigma-70 family)
MDSPPDSSILDGNGLFARARAGDQAAWTELFETCYPKVIRVIRRKLNSPSIRSLYDSTDFASDVWKSLAANAERLDFPTMDSLMGFLVHVAENKLNDELRRQSTRKRDRNRDRPDSDQRALASSDPTPSAFAQERERLEQILGRADDEQGREVIRLKRLGYRNEEIAEQLGWHVRKVQRFLKGLDDTSASSGA